MFALFFTSTTGLISLTRRHKQTKKENSSPARARAKKKKKKKEVHTLEKKTP